MLIKDIVLIANSPGELASLVKPVIQKFKEKSPESKIILILTPCQYSSGKEIEFAKTHLKADLIVSSDEYKKWLFKNSTPQGLNPSNSGIILFVGGDLFHAMFVAKKLNYPAYAYLAGKTVSWVPFFRKFFVPDKNKFIKKIPHEKLIEVGDLMSEPQDILSKQEALDKWKIDPNHPVIAMLPGSRAWEIKHVLPLYHKIAKTIKSENSNIQLMLIISPFTSIKDIEQFEEHKIFDVFAHFDSLSCADIALTIPGTNTAQLATIELPMIVIFPLDKPEAIPLEGFMHYVASIPILGIGIKKIIAKTISIRTKFFAIPNIKANCEIIPEFRGKINARIIAYKLLKILYDKNELVNISKHLKEIMKPQNAAKKIADEVLYGNI